MASLSPFDKSRARWHLQYGNGTPAGDRARLEAAMDNIEDGVWLARIKEQLDRCDRAWRASEKDAQGSGVEYAELITGDINRSVVRQRSERLRARRENYIAECDDLADMLFVPNYRNPQHYYTRFYTEGGSYIKAVPGPADTSVGTNLWLVTHRALSAGGLHI